MKGDTQAKLVGSVAEIKNVASGKTALLVEDNIVLAMDMVDSLTRLGASAIETAATVEAALLEIDRNTFDFAILDLNLRGSVSFEVAHRLVKDGTPFVFVTGYGSKIDMPEDLSHIEILTKPIDEGTLSHTIERILEI